MKMRALMTILVLLAVSASAVFASDYATEVDSYVAGDGTSALYVNPNSALGEPGRTTPIWNSSPPASQDVTMFNPAWFYNQIVSIGPNGSLVLKFDHQVLDNTAGAVWGFDFIVFGNTFFVDSTELTGVVDASRTEADPGIISVSQNGIDWYEVSGVFADTLFPTQGYMDTSHSQGDDGAVATDFTRPVRPDLQYDGWAYADVLEYYETSGGGTPVDFHSTGLDWIQYVKIEVSDGDDWYTQVDAISDVSVPLGGDFNMDGVVNGQDFLAWNQGYGTSYAKRSDGDSNGDGIVNGTDFLVWNSSYGEVPSSAPEPTTACLLIAAGSAWLRRRR